MITNTILLPQEPELLVDPNGKRKELTLVRGKKGGGRKKKEKEKKKNFFLHYKNLLLTLCGLSTAFVQSVRKRGCGSAIFREDGYLNI